MKTDVTSVKVTPIVFGIIAVVMVMAYITGGPEQTDSRNTTESSWQQEQGVRREVFLARPGVWERVDLPHGYPEFTFNTGECRMRIKTPDGKIYSDSKGTGDHIPGLGPTFWIMSEEKTPCRFVVYLFT